MKNSPRKIIFKKVNDFDKSYNKLVSIGDKSWSSLINYHLTNFKIYSLAKTHKPDIIKTNHLIASQNL